MSKKKETRIHPKLFVHKYGDKGQIASSEPYTLRCEGGNRYYEQPPSSGKYYNMDWSYNEEKSKESIMLEKQRRMDRKAQIQKELEEISEIESSLSSAEEKEDFSNSKQKAASGKKVIKEELESLYK